MDSFLSFLIAFLPVFGILALCLMAIGVIAAFNKKDVDDIHALGRLTVSEEISLKFAKKLEKYNAESDKAWDDYCREYYAKHGHYPRSNNGDFASGFMLGHFF